MSRRKLRIIVNAIPLVNVNTGIGRYLKCLYGALESLCGSELEMGYFDGTRVSRAMPQGPEDLQNWSSQVNLFWRLPARVALAVRVLVQLKREICFRRAAQEYDIYHEAGFFPFSGLAGQKTVFTIHDLSLLRFPQYHPLERVLFFRHFFAKRCRSVDRFLTVSHFTRKETEHFLELSAERLTVTPLAHDQQLFYPRTAGETAKVRRRFALPERYFIFVGSGDPRKNFNVIPRALKQADLRIPVVLVGWSGWSSAETSKKGLIPIGYIDDEDLAALYSGAMALIYPSVYEGFGLPVLEAMACGCPVVCSRQASLPEVAGSDALYLEDPSNSAELALLLQNVNDQPALRQRLAESGRIRAAEFSWERTARKTSQVFKNLV